MEIYKLKVSIQREKIGGEIGFGTFPAPKDITVAVVASNNIAR